MMVATMRERARYVKILENTAPLYEKEGRPLPPPSSAIDYVNKMLAVA